MIWEEPLVSVVVGTVVGTSFFTRGSFFLFLFLFLFLFFLCALTHSSLFFFLFFFVDRNTGVARVVVDVVTMGLWYYGVPINIIMVVQYCQQNVSPISQKL